MCKNGEVQTHAKTPPPPLGNNWYSYVAGDPINNSDPSGYFAPAAGGVFIIAAAGFAAYAATHVIVEVLTMGVNQYYKIQDKGKSGEIAAKRKRCFQLLKKVREGLRKAIEACKQMYPCDKAKQSECIRLRHIKAIDVMKSADCREFWPQGDPRPVGDR